MGLLKHHADVRPLNFSQDGTLRVEQFLPVQQNAPGVIALLPGQQPRHAHGGDGLSGAGFPHKAENLAVPDGEAHAAYRLPVPAVEPDVEILNFQHQPSPPFRCCKPSPMSPTPKIIQTRVRPVPRAYHGALRNIPWLSDSI